VLGDDKNMHWSDLWQTSGVNSVRPENHKDTNQK
jgi:hypothetical protein